MNMSKSNFNNKGEILNLITKEQELKTKLKLYQTINNEYVNLSKNIDTNEKRNHFNNLLENLLTLKEEIMLLAHEIRELRYELINFNDKINKNKTITDKKLIDIIKMMEDQNRELIKNKSAINDFTGSSKEFSKIFVSENMKYIFLFLILAILIFNIVTSIAVPYKTNLEQMILGILVVVGSYYLYQIIIKGVKNII